MLAISFMVGLAYVTKYAGMDTVLGLSLTRTGWIYPFFGTLLGWLGVALTGTDAGSNALFGNLQKVTAEQIGISPVLMASANSRRRRDGQDDRRAEHRGGLDRVRARGPRGRRVQGRLLAQHRARVARRARRPALRLRHPVGRSRVERRWNSCERAASSWRSRARGERAARPSRGAAHHARPRPLPRRADPEGDVPGRRPDGARLRAARPRPPRPPRARDARSTGARSGRRAGGSRSTRARTSWSACCARSRATSSSSRAATAARSTASWPPSRAGLNVLADKPWLIAAADFPKLEKALDARGAEAARRLRRHDGALGDHDRSCSASWPATRRWRGDRAGQRGGAGGRDGERPQPDEGGRGRREPAAGLVLRHRGAGRGARRRRDAPRGPRAVPALPRAADRLPLGDRACLGAKQWPTVARPRTQLLRAHRRQAADRRPRRAAARRPLDYFANGEVSYTIRGAHVRLRALWNYEAPEGGGDTHAAIVRGQPLARRDPPGRRAEVAARALRVARTSPPTRRRVKAALERRVAELAKARPGLTVEDEGAAAAGRASPTATASATRPTSPR